MEKQRKGHGEEKRVSSVQHRQKANIRLRYIFKVHFSREKKNLLCYVFVSFFLVYTHT